LVRASQFWSFSGSSYHTLHGSFFSDIPFDSLWAVETLTSSKLRHHTLTRWNLYLSVTARVCFKTKPSEEVGFDRVPVGSRGPQLYTDRRSFALAMASRSAGAQGKLRWLNTVTGVCEPDAFSVW
jgi:hypothetical protein